MDIKPYEDIWTFEAMTYRNSCAVQQRNWHFVHDLS